MKRMKEVPGYKHQFGAPCKNMHVGILDCKDETEVVRALGRSDTRKS